MPTDLLLHPVVDDATRREFLTLVAGAGLLAGCGGDDDVPAAGATQVFTDDAGREVAVPTSPRRIVSLFDTGDGAALLSVGAPLVGVHSRPSLRYVLERYDLDGIEVIEDTGSPNLEVVALLRPDLIVGLASMAGEPIVGSTADPGQLEAIAPTVFLDQMRPVEDYMSAIGRLSGRGEEVARQQVEWQDSLAEARARLAEQTRDLSWMLLGTEEDGTNVFVFSQDSPSLLRRVGDDLGVQLTPVARSNAPGDTSVTVSSERLLEISADLILWGDGNDPTTQPLWPQLPAVQAGQAKQIGPQPFGASYDGLHEALAIIERVLPGVRSDVVDESAWT